MNSASEFDWTAFQRSVWVGTDDLAFREVYSSRACPHCATFQLVRHALPRYLKILRRVGLNLRHYICSGCGEASIVRHRSHTPVDISRGISLQ